jgi:hypothetical protein
VINDRDEAARIADLMLDLGARLDASLTHVQKVAPAEDFVAYRRAVGKVMGEILLEVLNPLYALHPDLKPSQLR